MPPSSNSRRAMPWTISGRHKKAEHRRVLFLRAHRLAIWPSIQPVIAASSQTTVLAPNEICLGNVPAFIQEQGLMTSPKPDDAALGAEGNRAQGCCALASTRRLHWIKQEINELVTCQHWFGFRFLKRGTRLSTNPAPLFGHSGDTSPCSPASALNQTKPMSPNVQTFEPICSGRKAPLLLLWLITAGNGHKVTQEILRKPNW